MSESVVSGTTGSGFREYYEGEAEDWAKILRLDAPVFIDFGDCLGCLPGEIEHKFYCRISQGGSGLRVVNQPEGRTRLVQYLGTTFTEGEFPYEFPGSAVELRSE